MSRKRVHEPRVPEEGLRMQSAAAVADRSKVPMDPSSAASRARVLSRRKFLSVIGLSSLAVTFVRLPLAHDRGWIAAAAHAATDVVRDTFNGFLVFLVPGPDEYSLAQGVSTPEPGAIEANVTDVLIDTLDRSAPYVPSFSAIVAATLNDLALLVNPNPTGPFLSQFARLSFAEKVGVVQVMDGAEPLKPLSGVLLAFGAYLVYSEGGAFDPETRTLTGTPVGWTLSSYQGVADGRDEFRGYYRE